MKDDFFTSLSYSFLAFLGIILVIGCILLFASLRPILLNIEREANQQSQQYVESTQTRLYQLARKHDDLQADIDRLSVDAGNQEVVVGMVARQESLLAEMEEEAGRIPAEEIPEKVKQLLEKGK